MDRDRGGSRDRRGGREFGGERRMYPTTCSDCGAACEVPFEPKEGRPVYCRDCYKNHRRF